MSGNQKIEIFYNNGVEFVKVATYEFSVARPWYFSIGMLLVYFLFISILLYLYYKWNKIRYTEKLKLKEEELKHQKEIIQIELEAENKLKLQEYEKHMLEMQIQSKASEVAGKSLSIAKQSEMIESIKRILETETDLNQLKNKINKNKHLRQSRRTPCATKFSSGRYSATRKSSTAARCSATRRARCGPAG